MKQIVEELKTGSVKVVEAPAPRCGRGEVLVRNAVSLISPGTEKLMIEMGKKSLLGKAMARPDLLTLAFEKAKREGFLQVFREAMQRLDEPLPLGYSCAGEIVEIGSAVQDFAVGEKVACAGHGHASHAEFVSVPQDLCVRLPSRPDGRAIDCDEAAFVMLGGIALHGLRRAEVTAGETVVVVGLGLIGLLVAQIARAQGLRVVGIDVSKEKVALARELHCPNAYVLGEEDVEQAILSLTRGAGADAVVLAAATQDSSPVKLAERITRERGRIVLVGVSDLELTRKAFWDKELSFTVSKASGPSRLLNPGHGLLPPELVRWNEKRNLEAFLQLVADGTVSVRKLLTHRFPIADALNGYQMILDGSQPYIGVLIDYPSGTDLTSTIRLKAVTAGTAPDGSPARGRIGIIGAGMFTRNILLPNLQRAGGVTFVGVATKTGVTSSHVGNRFGFEFATTDHKALLADSRVSSVVITTRHDLHAPLVAEALAAGKHVFVEKPLCIRAAEIDTLVEAWRRCERAPMFMVGFNRRFSVLSEALRARLKGRTTPLQALFRVNAGYIPATHWVHDPAVGGGRILGEICHFIDYLQFLTGSDPVEVHAMSIGGSTTKYQCDDNVSLSLRFADGSCGTIVYTAMGTKTFSRERVELFWGESVAVLDDFRALEYVHGSTRAKRKLGGQDLGYAAEIREFVSGDPAGSPERFRQAIVTSLAALGAVESLQTGRPVRLKDVAIES